jgi:outer membrane protein
MRQLRTYCVIACLFPSVVAAQPTSEPSGNRLSLETAIRLAVENNRLLATQRLQIDRAEQDIGATRARRLPSLETSFFGSQLLTPVDFSFPQGAFGTFPGIGPIPSVDSVISVPRQPTAFVTAQASQPLSQLHQIGLRVKAAELAREVEKERTREQQIALVNNVKRLYFAILQTESALASNKEAIALYRELDRTLTIRVAQQVALRADALDVQYRLANEELTRVTNTNTLASQKEQLNHLLARDVRTGFELEPVSAVTVADIDVAAAQARALENRADLKEARLKLQQAELDEQVKKADRIPEVSLAVSYSSYFNIDVLPKNFAAMGIQVKWEPFDWGRKTSEIAGKTYAVEQARLNVRDLEDQVVLDVNNRYRKVTEAKALLQVAESAQSTVRERLRVRTNQYQIQAAMLSDVMQLRSELAAMDDRKQQALVAFWTARANFEQAVGEEVVR